MLLSSVSLLSIYLLLKVSVKLLINILLVVFSEFPVDSTSLVVSLFKTFLFKSKVILFDFTLIGVVDIFLLSFSVLERVSNEIIFEKFNFISLSSLSGK